MKKFINEYIILLIVLTFIFISLLFFFFNQKNSLQKKPIPVPSPTQTSHLSSSPIPKRVSVKFKTTVSQTLIQQKLTEYNAKIVATDNDIHLSVLEVPEGQEATIIEKLQQGGIVDYAERDYYMKHHFRPNDPNITQQYQIDAVHLPEAWDVTQGNGMLVGVVDSGVMVNHPDLMGRIGTTKNIDDGSTNVDDTNTDGHGTNVVGMITADTNNGVGIAGTCPGCKIVFAKTPETSVTKSAMGITWAVDQGAKIINVSSGTPVAVKSLQDAAAYVWSKGAILVVSAGEDETATTKEYPCGYPNVLCVTATDRTDTVPAIDGRGDWIKLAAPGENVYTTKNDGTYATADGTSFASPLVAGIAALVWSTPYGTSNQAVVDRLCNTADKIKGTGPTTLTCGRVNAAAAVGAATTATPSGSQTSPVPTQPIEASPTFMTMIGDCMINNTCPTTPPETSTPNPTPTTHPSTTGNPPTIPASGDGGLLQLIFLLIGLIIKFLLG